MIYISEYSNLIDGLPIGLVAEQSFDVEASSKASEPFHASTRFILVYASESACLAFGRSPVADERYHCLPQGATRIYPVNVGDSLAAISPKEL